MSLEQFIKDFTAEFEMTEPDEIRAETSYRDLDEWDSLLGLAIIGMVNNKYHIKISGEEVRNAKTVENLFNLVKSKQG